MTRQALSLKARAIGLLAQREHSRAELRRKLLRIEQQRRERLVVVMRGAGSTVRVECTSDALSCAADVDPADAAGAADGADAADAAAAVQATVDALLDTLAADGFLDDTRFVESRVHMRSQRFGARRIQQELAQHGLKLDAEQQANLRASDLERAHDVWLRRFGPEPSRDLEDRARQTRFLIARGFPPDVVHRLLRA